jgi:hypothetical protein
MPDLGKPFTVHLVLTTCGVGSEPLNPGLPPGGRLSPPCAHSGSDAAYGCDDATYRTDPKKGVA